MVERKNKNNDGGVARLARWSATSAYSAANFSTMSPPPPPPESKKLLGFGSSSKNIPAPVEPSLLPIEHDDLKQGCLYIVKIRNVSVALFEGWDDDMCCFAVLRSDSTPMRWSEARYIPGDFDAYDAFDDAGNPPVHLWTRHLRVSVPTNWFSIFEEARRKQRSWGQEPAVDDFYYADQEALKKPVERQVLPPLTEQSSTNGKTEDSSVPDSAAASGHDVPAGSPEPSSRGAPSVKAASSSAADDSDSVSAPVTPSSHDGHGISNGTAAAHIQQQSTTSTTAAVPAIPAPAPAPAQTPSIPATPPTPTVQRENSKHLVQESISANNSSIQTKQPHPQKDLFKSDLSFSHDGDRFSLQSSGYQRPPVPEVPAPAPANNKKQNGVTPSKSKRRSVQDLFRSKN
ncbi:hypothetical protein BCR43DRAFT_524226 [Syncephalastrum racemosum]|uniref:Uncharacterized protein n=1 Tax=Syncephalastrum racemosum TaxID=13706 RepID=A0A1X2HH07_SYNRA|nr:hypothetical protein BCR43DRAFT_524226 [Syncephalastrum racemosum]